MASCGHLVGAISNYVYFWLLRTDGTGNFYISDAIRYDAEGSDSVVSVTEVLTASALSASTLLATRWRGFTAGNYVHDILLCGSAGRVCQGGQHDGSGFHACILARCIALHVPPGLKFQVSCR